MKVRTDFVTNSSSSSFIFTKKLSDEDIRRLWSQFYENARKEACVGEREALAFEFEWSLEKIKPIDAHDHEGRLITLEFKDFYLINTCIKSMTVSSSL